MTTICILLLAVVATASATTVNRAIGDIPDSVFITAIECFRDQMPCRDPPLAPMQIEEISLNINRTDMTILANLKNVVISKLEQFEVVDLNVNMLSGTMAATVLFPSLDLSSSYVGSFAINTPERSFAAAGTGEASFEVQDLRFDCTGTFSINIFTAKIEVKSFDVVIRVGAIHPNINGLEGGPDTDDQANLFISESLVNYINGNNDLSTTIAQEILQAMNGYTSEHTINDIINSAEEECTVCVPPIP